MMSINSLTGLLLITLVAILLFVLYQLIDMFQSTKINKYEKGLWLIAFLVLSLPTAIIWMIIKQMKGGKHK